jgi:bifunctional DNA-binding transcriptional regulator/antitoxin component of YhaV-PrlF toxin-antitoxin module
VPSRFYIAFPVGTFRRLGLKQGDRLGWDLTLDDGEIVRGGLRTTKSKRR